MNQQKHDFIRIIESNKGIIRSLCRAYYVSAEDQKDVFQDIVLQLWKSFATFRGDAEISTWIYRVSLNTILSKIRNDNRKINAQSISASELLLANAKADDDTELLHLVLQSLRDLDKAIVILYLEGYKTKEIAGILNLTPTNITTRMSRVKSELKTKFKDKQYAVG